MRKVRYPLLMKACKQGLVQGVGLNDPLPTFRTDLGGGDFKLHNYTGSFTPVCFSLVPAVVQYFK